MKQSPLLAATVLFLSSTGVRAQLDDERLDAAWEVACGVSGSAYALRVDDVVFPTCEAAFGDPERRERNEGARRARILRVVAAGSRLDVLHQDPRLHPPEARPVEGLHLLTVTDAEVEELACDQPAEDGALDAGPEGSADDDADAGIVSEASFERVAFVQVSAPFDRYCPAGVYPVRVDDALGAEGQVVTIDPRGLLSLYRGDLLWVPHDEAKEAPPIRMIWRSGFVVIVEDKSKPKPKKKRRKRRRRRGRR